jgi:hypothetical protein
MVLQLIVAIFPWLLGLGAVAAIAYAVIRYQRPKK